jgi:pyruvate,orthophosphate dikinase
MSKKYVYMFNEGSADMRNLLGGKGSGLAEMTNLGLPVPQGFTVTTEACTRYYEDGKKIASEIMAEIETAMSALEKKRARRSAIKAIRSLYRFVPVHAFQCGHDGYRSQPRP